MQKKPTSEVACTSHVQKKSTYSSDDGNLLNLLNYCTRSGASQTPPSTSPGTDDGNLLNTHCTYPGHCGQCTSVGTKCPDRTITRPGDGKCNVGTKCLDGFITRPGGSKCNVGTKCLDGFITRPGDGKCNVSTKCSDCTITCHAGGKSNVGTKCSDCTITCHAGNYCLHPMFNSDTVTCPAEASSMDPCSA